MWNKNERVGMADQAKGRVKQAVGAITGDKTLKAEGTVDETKGKIQEAIGRVQRETGDVLQRAGTAMKGGKVAKVLLLTALLAGGIACTQRAADKTKDGVDTALEATKTGANAAIDATKTAGDKTADVARDMADKTRDAAEATSDAVSDTWITTKVKAKLADEKVLKGSDISVATRNQVVTLNGTVASMVASTRAERIAGGTERVKSVVNLLTVK